MPKYKVNGKTYDIPEEKVAKFESAYPDATVDIYDGATGKGYSIPVGKRDAFKKKYPKWSYTSAEKNTDEGEEQETVASAPPAPVAPKQEDKQEPWKPTPIQKAFMIDQIGSGVRQSVKTMQGMVDNSKRLGESMTQKGRDRKKSGEMQARMSGQPTRVLGLSPSASNGEGKGEGGQSSFNTTSPTPYGVKMVDGELKTEWLLPDGSLSTDITDADKAEYGARAVRLRNDFVKRMQENGLDPSKQEDVEAQRQKDLLDESQKRVDIRLRENERKLRKMQDKRAKDFDESMKWDDSQGFWDNMTRIIGGSVRRSVENQHPTNRPQESLTKEDKDLRTLTTENQVLNDARKLLETRQLRKSNGFMGGFWNIGNNSRNMAMGAKHTLTDLDLYAGGAMSLQKASQLLEIEDKLKQGGEVTDAEASLIYSTMLGQDVAHNTDTPHGYNAAQITVEMFPFMAQMMLNPASGLSQALVKKFGKSGLKKIALTVAGDIAESAVLANTLQAPATIADAMERYQGEAVEGKDGIEFDGSHNALSAIGNTEGAAIIENYTEMLGEHFGVIGDFAGKMIGKGARKMGAGKVVDTVSDLVGKVKGTEWAKAISDLEKRAHWNGTVGEVLEEEAGIVLNSLFVGDNKFSDLVDADQQIDIVLGVGLFGGFVSGIKTLGYPAMRAKAKGTLRKRDGIGGWRFGEDWESMRSEIDSAEEGDLSDVVTNLINTHAKTNEQARAIVEYAQALMKARGYDLASANAIADGTMTPEEQDAEESFEHGVQIAEDQDSEAMNDARIMMERERQRLASATSEEYVAQYFDGEDAVNNLSNMGADDELRSIATDYVNARNVYNGMIQRVRDDIDGRIAQSDAQIESRVNRQTGKIQPATMKIGDREVYIVSGHVAVFDDGSGVDAKNSSESIIIQDAETGKIEFADPTQILSVGIEMDAETEKASAREQIRQEMAQEAADNIDGTVSIAPGATYSILDIDGNAEEISILGPSADENGMPIEGSVDIQYADGTIQSVATADLQQWVDAANEQRAREFAEERDAERSAEEESKREADESGLSNPNRRTDLMPDEYETPYDKLPTRAVRYIESERGTGGTLYQDEQGNDAVVIAAIDNENYVGYFREYDEQGNPTNRWSAKFQNGSGVRENHRDMMQIAQELLPAGHELTEHTSVSTDGLRNLANQLKHGYELQYDEEGNVVTDLVAVNMMARENVLGLPQYRPGSEANVRVRLEDEDKAEVNAKLAQFLAPFGLDENAIHWDGNKLMVEHPVLRRADTPEEETSSQNDEIALNDDGFIPIDPEAIEIPTPESSDNTKKGENLSQNQGENFPESGEKPSALSRIPKDEDGDPIYDQTEPETAWDALMEQTEGDEEIARSVIEQEIAEKEAALKKLEKEKPKAGLSTAQKIEAGKEKKKAMEAIQKSIEHWKSMLDTPEKRRAEAEALQAEEEARIRAEREAAEAEARAQEKQRRDAEARAESERLRREKEERDGIPEMAHDTPEAARQRGKRRIGTTIYTRQEPITEKIEGKEVTIDFNEKKEGHRPKGRIVVIEAAQGQASHMEGQRNPMFFIDEAQPKDRVDDESILIEQKHAREIKPSLITDFNDMPDPFRGAPTVNLRGETIQGNHRMATLRYMYANEPEAQKRYREYLYENADKFGFTPEQAQAIAFMEEPILVNMIDVDDQMAIELGQDTATSRETGGKERIDDFNLANTIEDKMGRFMDTLLTDDSEEGESLRSLIRRNGLESLKYLRDMGKITDRQYRTAVNLQDGILTDEGVEDVEKFIKRTFFAGESREFEEMFDTLPAKAQSAVLAQIWRDTKTEEADKATPHVKEAVKAFYAMMSIPQFKEAKNFKDALRAAEMWRAQTEFNDDGDIVSNQNRHSNFAIQLAAMMKGSSMKETRAVLKQMLDWMQDSGPKDNMFEALEEETEQDRTFAGAVKKVLKMDYKAGETSPVMATNRNQESTTDKPADALEPEDKQTGKEEADSGLLDNKEGENHQPSLGEQIDEAEAGVNTDPSDAQKEAGNYKKGHVKVGKFDVTIENPKGSIRRGVDAGGKAWETTMTHTYGYIRGTKAPDGDHIDVYISSDVDGWNGQKAFVVDQYNPDGTFDEHKVMLGFNSKEEAYQAYLSNYEKDWDKGRRLDVTEADLGDFEKWIESSKRKTKPFAEYKSVKSNSKNVETETKDTEDENGENGGTDVAGNNQASPSGKQGGSRNDRGGKRTESRTGETESGRGAGTEIGSTAPTAEVTKDFELTEDDLNAISKDSGIDESLIDGARDYLEGDRSPWAEMCYKTVKDYVRNTRNDSGRGSRNADSVQLAEGESDPTGGIMGEEGSRDRGEDREDGDGDVSGSGTSRTDDEGSGRALSGAEGTEGVESPESDRGEDDSSAGDTGRGSGTGSKRSNVRKPRRKGSDKGNASDTGRGDAENVGAQSSTGEETAQGMIDDALATLKDIFKNPGMARPGQLNDVTTLLAGLGVNAVRFIGATAKLGCGLVMKGYYKFARWQGEMHRNLDPLLMAHTDLTDEQIAEFIRSAWDMKMNYRGERKKISEWAAELEAEELRKLAQMGIAEKRKLQEEAEDIKVIPCDLDNIRETLPFLLPAQHEDVEKAERQMNRPDHADREHGYGKGYLFTNGTGTGKTYTGLGIAKRFIKQGKGRILIVTVNDTKISDWIKDAKNLGIEATQLPDTKSKGKGVVVTQYANLRQNYALLEDEFDLIIYDESHKLMENQEGMAGSTAEMHHLIAARDARAVIEREIEISELGKHHREVMDKVEYLSELLNILLKGPLASLEERKKLKDSGYKSEQAIRDDLQKAGEEEERLKDEIENLIEITLADDAQCERAEQISKNTKTVFLSATPFNTPASLDYAEGYIFSYPEGKEGTPRRDRRNDFLRHNFGKSHRRNNRGDMTRMSEGQITDPEAVEEEEINFSNTLQDKLRTMSGRMLDSAFDYSRTFPKFDMPEAQRVNEAMSEINSGPLKPYFKRTLLDYNYSTAFWEIIKTGFALPRIKEHIALGRKVVVFHRRKASNQGVYCPFATGIQEALNSKSEIDKAAARVFAGEFRDLLQWEASLDYTYPQDRILQEFVTDEERAEYEKEMETWRKKRDIAIQNGKRVPPEPKLKSKRVGIFNGDQTATEKQQAVDNFNHPDSEQDVIVVQVQSGKEGISLHDTDGKHQRVMMSLALPQSPIEFIQAEGRIYRVGNMSDAIFEYPLLGIDRELFDFAMKINGRSQTSENLAMGDQSRGLRDSITRGALGSTQIPVAEGQGKGGKMLDSRQTQNATGFDHAMNNWKEWRDKEKDLPYDDRSIPDPLGYKLMEWAGAERGETVLVGYAGEGSAARYAPSSTKLIALESESGKLARLAALLGGGGRKILGESFMDYSPVNKADVVVIKTASGSYKEGFSTNKRSIRDINKALQHTEDSGRIVAIVPTEDLKGVGGILKMLENKRSSDGCVARTVINLPADVFGMESSIIVIDKNQEPSIATANAAKGIQIKDIKTGASIEEILSELRNEEVEKREVDRIAKAVKRTKKTLAPFQNNRLVRTERWNGKSQKAIHISRHEVWIRFTTYIVPVNADLHRISNGISVSFSQLGQRSYLEEIANEWAGCNKYRQMDFEEFKERHNGKFRNEGQYQEAYDLMGYICNLIEAATGKTATQLSNIAEGKAENQIKEDMTLSEFQDIYKTLDSGSEELDALAERVFAVAGQIKGLKFKMADGRVFSGHNVMAHYAPSKNAIELNADMFNSFRVTEEQKAQCILHETIHAVTCWALAQYKKASEEERKAMGALADACRDIEDVFKAINNDSFRAELQAKSKLRDNAMYGLTDEYEMIAEMANPAFRMALKAKRLWRQLVNGIKKLFGIDVMDSGEGATSAFEVLNEAINTILDNFDASEYADYQSNPHFNERNHEMNLFDFAEAQDLDKKSTSEEKRNEGSRWIQKSLFDEWTPVDNTADENNEQQKEEFNPAAAAANEDIDAFTEKAMNLYERYGLFAERRPELTDALAERMDRELMDEAERLRGHLEEYYLSEGNTGEDSRRMARDMTARVIAETTLRLSPEAMTEIGKARQERAGVSSEANGESSMVTAGGEIVTFTSDLRPQHSADYVEVAPLRKLEAGEYTHVERKFTKTGEFNFTGKDRIESTDDVAYIFRSLEDYSIENTFLVLVNEAGHPTILHIGMGGPTVSPVDLTAVRGAMDAFGGKEAYFVHNHPSGVLRPSPQDQAILRKVEEILGDEVDCEGVIIDVTSGRYSAFSTDMLAGHYDENQRNDSNANDETEHYAIRMNRSVRTAEGKDVENLPVIRQAKDVAELVAKKRLGAGSKINYLLLANNNTVIGNLHTAYSSFGESTEALAEEMTRMGVRYGAMSVIPYGNSKLSSADLRGLSDAVKEKSGGSLKMLDALEIGSRTGEGFRSAMDEGMMEPEAEYGGFENDGGIRFRIREEAAPRKTGTGYKVFVLKNGKLYPPMVANPKGEATPVGVWLDADAAPIAGTSKTGRKQVKAGGKGTQGGSGRLAYRPGWHLGEIPYALQFNRKDETGEKELFPKDFVWAEVEYANDVDYQEEAMSYGYNKNGKFQHSYAGLPRLPKNGAYKYRTNPNPETDPWIITGAMKVNRLLTPSEVDEMVKAAGRDPQKRQEGAITDDQINELNAQLGERGRQGDGGYTDAELSMINDPWLKASWGEAQRSKKRQKAFADRMRKAMKERVQYLADMLGVEIEIVEDTSTLTGRKQRAKGWYDTRTGKITVVVPNHSSIDDMHITVLHEAVAHHGLRELFGQKFDDFLDAVYQHAENGIKETIDLLATRNGWNRREATEEYLAMLAEQTNFKDVTASWWRKIKDLFMDFLRNCGFNIDMTLSDNELRYVLWMSWKNLQHPGAFRSMLGVAERVAKEYELGVGEYSENTEGNPSNAAEPSERFRDGDFTARDRKTAASVYENMLARGSWQFKEATQDSMLGLKSLYESVLTQGDKKRRRDFRIEDVAGYENAYVYENRMSSANNGEQHQYFTEYMKPLLTSIHNLCGKDEQERQMLTDYMMAKHGLERNEYMRNEAAAAGEETERDFAGLCGLTGEDDWQAAEDAAQKIVDDYEGTHDMGEIADLWNRTKDATSATLEKIYLSGMISDETYQKTLAMYDHYIPLRGWEETTSDEVYGYLTSKDGPLFGSVWKHAEGRESKADDPIATIAKMADDAIRQGNRNIMKQRFLNFAHAHPSDLVSVSELWLEYDDVTDEWKPVFADLEPDMTAEEVKEEIEKFEAKMEALQAADPDKYKRGKDARHIPFKVVRGNLDEHQVLVKRNGHTYVMTINGNPRASQALNGLTNPDTDMGGVYGKILKGASYVNRQLSAFYTTRNPDFVMSNFLRDALYSNCMTWIKETPNYALRFHRNYGRVNPAVMARLLSKWEKGKLSDGNRLERAFKEFMLGGGETGYTSVRDIEEHKRAIAKEMRKMSGRGPKALGQKAWQWLTEKLDLLNRSVENTARFAAFLTSREMGRSLDRSIYDAKEISVNFNKKGAGDRFVDANGQTKGGKAGAYIGGAGRSLYVFWNAGVQGMTNFGRAGKRHPKKALAGAAALFTLGATIPLLAQMLGGGDGDDDDKNAYYNLPEYIRRSNICFKAGERWVTIPLPIEYRAIYGLGELATGTISGNERYSDAELAYYMAAQVSQILPLDFMEGANPTSHDGLDWKSVSHPFIPSALKPFTEAYIMNRGWTGMPVAKETPFNALDPEFKRTYQSTDQHLTEMSRWLNETTGGNDYKKGAIDINPAKIEYMLNGTFGGMFSFPMKLKKTGETILGDREFEWRNIPLANRVVKTGDERTANRKLQNEYYKYRSEAEKTEHEFRGYQKEGARGIMESARRADFMMNSDEFLRWQIIEAYEPTLTALRKAGQEASEKEKKEYQEEYYTRMRELVDAMHEPRRFLNQR